ncbi:MAG TPA: 2,3-bisphosphoglycerate-independent phosphoglycerate mutase [Solirubrobacteraceae bacterium]|jgi:2,3-bisphosphoglycerate-independent phosphoglycerate mutase|nr:2,3-bisphosphoglycerate-independent phosphoglycerate mutase [Solirubrobacteraceae bacterium]
MGAPEGWQAVRAPCVCLVVLDGWGLAEPGPGNAISLADTPVFDELWDSFPHTTLTACGAAVGLPEGQMGNSEVGHLNLGAGAVVKQDLVRIDEAIADGSFARNEVLRAAFAGDGSTGVTDTSAGEKGGSGVVPSGSATPRIHLLGLVSDGGVHSSLEHLRALISLGGELAPEADLVLHAFTDGRDTLPHAGVDYLAELDAIAGVRVGSVVGRYWAMDRDRRWERTQRAYDMLVHGRGRAGSVPAASGEQAVRDAYERGETDEFVEPTLVGGEARIRPGDSVLCFNFRPDRMRELVRALAEPGFGEGAGGGAAHATGAEAESQAATAELPGWEGRGGAPAVSRLATLTEYEEGWPYPVAFAPQRPETTLSQVIASSGARQLHVAETEKYPHVTYFFNGGEETPCAGERRELVASPRDVPTYDHKPQMSAREAAAAFVGAWREGGTGGKGGADGGRAADREGGEDGFRFGVINFANADMVGHTGVIAAAVTAIETVDECLGKVLEVVRESGGVCVVTADHGNADNMLEPDGSPNTAHSLNPVPLILTAPGLELRAQGGILADVAPTVLDLLGIAQPVQMTGTSLIVG